MGLVRPTEPSLDGELGVIRPVGPASFEELSAMIRDAIAFCAMHQIRELLVDTTGATGFESPSTTERFQAVEAWAAAGMGRVRLAVVAEAEHIDPRRFGVTVAHNRGMLSNIFAAESEARAWLEAMRTARPGNASDPRDAP